MSRPEQGAGGAGSGEPGALGAAQLGGRASLGVRCGSDTCFMLPVSRVPAASAFPGFS